MAPPAPARNDRDGELWRVLVHEPVARMVATEEAVPRRTDRKAVVDRDQGGVAGLAPALDVKGDRPMPRSRLPLAPVVGVMEHVTEESGILAASAADDHELSLQGERG